MKVNENNARVGRSIHPFEVEPTGCSLDDQTNTSFDPRFQLVSGFSITEYDFYESNGIFPKLESIPGYDAKYYDD